MRHHFPLELALREPVADLNLHRQQREFALAVLLRLLMLLYDLSLHSIT